MKILQNLFIAIVLIALTLTMTALIGNQRVMNDRLIEQGVRMKVHQAEMSYRFNKLESLESDRQSLEKERQVFLDYIHMQDVALETLAEKNAELEMDNRTYLYQLEQLANEEKTNHIIYRNKDTLMDGVKPIHAF